MRITQRLTRAARSRVGVFGMVAALAATSGGVAVQHGLVQILGMSIAKTTSAPPAPTITSGPSGTVSTASADFSFTDRQAGVGFLCSLDSGAAVQCDSGSKSYSGPLDQGSHTFSVVATAGGVSSFATSRTWAVDTVGPTATITFPSDGGQVSATAWSGTCKSAVCGTAADPSKVQAVAVAIQRSSDSAYWNGSTFGSSTAIFGAAKGTASWSFALPLPTANVSYNLTVRAIDGNGTSRDTLSTFVVDTIVPADPTFGSTPDDPTGSTSAHFSFSDADATANFVCELDKAAPGTCSSPVDYSGLSVADHTFQVTAVDPAGNSSNPVTYGWSVVSGVGFTIQGSMGSSLSPGATEPVDLTIHNPNNFTIQLQKVTVAVDDAGDCLSSNFTTYPLVGPLPVPANGDLVISGTSPYASNRPTVEMLNFSTSQDVCKDAALRLSFAGTATK